MGVLKAEALIPEDWSYSGRGNGRYSCFLYSVLSCRGIYVQPHTHDLAKMAFPRALKARACEFFTLYYNKCHTKETLYTPVRLHFRILECSLSIGRPGRAGTSSPRASPSRTWEGGRSMRRCGSGAGKGLLAKLHLI